MADLWDASFRERMLRQALSSDEIAQAVEAAETAAAERDALESVVVALYQSARALVADVLGDEAVTHLPLLKPPEPGAE